MRRLHRRFNILRWAEWGSAVLAAVVALFVVSGHYRHRRDAADQALEQNRLKMAAMRDHIKEYIDRIRMDMRVIALDGEVVAMSRNARDTIKAIYEEHYERHRLAEIYVIDRDFDGTRPPFMTFEHGDEAHDVDELHSLEKEADEYRTQIGHIRRFAQDPALEVLISRPVALCANKLGVIVSVPIRSKGELAGIVAGMIPSENICKALTRGNYANTAILSNDRGDFFGCADLPDETRRWFEARFHERGVTAFFATREETFDVGKYVSLWTPADIPGGQKWYLAFMYDKAAYLKDGGVAGTLAGWGSGGIVLLLGGMVLLLCRTLRQRLLAEEKVQEANTMLVDALETEKRLGCQLEQAREQAEAANRGKSEFLANMSHEIRTPMTAILGFAENILDSDQSDSERLNCVHTIRRNGEYLLGLINDILDLSKIEAGKMTIERRDCQPCRIVAEVAALMRVRADAKGLPFNIEYIGAIPETIPSDPTRLRQILINLIGNAIKFTETGSVRLVTRFVDESDAPCLQFDVIDTGRGMTEEQAAKLFQQFMQADTSTTRKFGGTGLGLAISKRFAELLGGDITVVETQMGVGSTFRVTVATGPLDGVAMQEDPFSATAVADTAGTVAQIDPTGLRGLHILLAEDGRDNQRLISFVLKKAGADVTAEENGKLALDAALAARGEGKPFDCILMDMQMPVMDGYEATGLLRRKGYTGPIIALTAHAMQGDREKCINAGCDDYATKPIDRTKLIALIRTHVSRGKTKIPSQNTPHARAPSPTEDDMIALSRGA